MPNRLCHLHWQKHQSDAKLQVQSQQAVMCGASSQHLQSDIHHNPHPAHVDLPGRIHLLRGQPDLPEALVPDGTRTNLFQRK